MKKTKKTQIIMVEESDLNTLRKEKNQTCVLMHRLMANILRSLPEIKEPVPAPTLKPVSVRTEDAIRLRRNAKEMGISPWRLVKMLLNEKKFLNEKNKVIE